MAATDATQNDVLRQLMPAFIQPLDGGHISVHLIVPNPHQPRKLAERPFDPEHNPEDAQLVQSVREHGVMQPIGVIALPLTGIFDPTAITSWSLASGGGGRRWRPGEKPSPR